MTTKAIAIASSFCIFNIILHSPAIASLPFPEGQFFDNQNQRPTWHLTLLKRNNTYYFHNLDLKTNQKFCLVRAVVSGTKNRPVFSWRDGTKTYRVAWQPSEPDVIRLQITNSSGKLMMNQLLNRQPGEFAEPEELRCAGKIIRT